MISKLKLLGDYAHLIEGKGNPLQLNESLKEAHVILLDFDLINDCCKYRGTDTMQFDQIKNIKLLLKNAKGNKVSDFPTIFIDRVNYKKDDDIEKTVKKAFKKIKRILENNSNDNELLKPIFDAFNEKIDYVKTDIRDKINRDEQNICSIRINNKLIGESEFYQSIISKTKSDIDKDYYNTYNTISLGYNKSCYVCGETKEKLYGFTDTFKFYSCNEEAYIAGGFKKSNAWKNYPVCPDCAAKLRDGKRLVENDFNRSFYGNRYFLIPCPILDRGNFNEIIENLMREYRDLSLRQSEEQNRNLMMDMEEDIFEIMADQKDQTTFTIFFYTASNSEFKILQEAEDILPSRFKKIIQAKRKVENYQEFENLKGLYKKGETQALSFNFGIVRTFFHPKSKKSARPDFTNDFLDITAKILKDRQISRQFILHRISDHLAQGFRREELYHDVCKAMIFMKFLYELNLIKNEPLRMEVKMESQYEDYFQKHPDFYDADIKKALFLEGVLAQHVMDIQYRERNATPFRSRLNGLKIDQRIVKRILPEAINKLEQYKKNYYRDLEEAISIYLESGEPDIGSMSVDEISFYFTMGMNLSRQFKSKKEIEGGDDE